MIIYCNQDTLQDRCDIWKQSQGDMEYYEGESKGVKFGCMPRLQQNVIQMSGTNGNLSPVWIYKNGLSRYGNIHYKDKTVVWIIKTASLYWDDPRKLRTVSVSHKTYYRKNSRSLVAPRSVFILVRSLWNLSSGLATLLRHWNVKAICPFHHPIS